MIEEPTLVHTFGVRVDGVDRCPLCPGEHGGPGPCDQSVYSKKRRRFIRIHLQEFITAYYNPDQRYASAVRARLNREYIDKPDDHDCSCWCPQERCGLTPEECGRRRHFHQACGECLRLRVQLKPQEPVEFGRTTQVHPPMPSVEMLDLLVRIAA